MAAGYGKRCENCYWKHKFIHQVEMERALFEHRKDEAIFVEYADWLYQRCGSKKAALRIDADAKVFLGVSAACVDITNGHALVEHFGSAQIMRHRSIRTFLGERKSLSIDEVARASASERLLMERMVDSLSKRPWSRTALRSYRDHLISSVEDGQIQIRSARLYLRAALGLLLTAKSTSAGAIDKSVVEKYLRSTPGQHDSLQRYLSFIGLRIPINRRKRATQRRAEIRKALVERLSLGHQLVVDENTLALALEYFHNIPCIRARSISAGAKRHRSQDALVLAYEGVEYCIPTAADRPLIKVAR